MSNENQGILGATRIATWMWLISAMLGAIAEGWAIFSSNRVAVRSCRTTTCHSQRLVSEKNGLQQAYID